MAELTPLPTRYHAVLRALRRYRSRLHRVVVARQRELEEARLGPQLRRKGEALLTYIRQVPARARQVRLPDPHAPDEELEIDLEPALNAQGNAARYFNRAARAERAARQIPSRLAQAERDQELAERVIANLQALAEDQTASADVLEHELDRAVAIIPEGLRSTLGISSPASRSAAASPSSKDPSVRSGIRAPSARLQPRRLTSSEGWEVLIGRSNEGNDYLTLHIARPEDYWFHVHGAAGSHVVLRRGKGKNEPSKQTIEEVAAWAAFYSQARNAGKVPVIVTRKKYVRKPRGAKPGLVTCEREKTLMVRPAEPKETHLPDES